MAKNLKNKTKDELISIIEELKKEKKINNSKLNQSKNIESMTDSLINNIPDVIIRFSTDKTILFANNAIYPIIDKYPEEIIGKSINDLELPNEVKDLWTANFDNIDNSNGLRQSDCFLDKLNKHYHNTFVEEKDTKGKVVSYLSISRDITEIDNIKNKFLEEKKRFQSIFQNVPIANYILDSKLNFLEFNQATLDLFEFPAEDLNSIPLIKLGLMDNEELDKAKRRQKKALKGIINPELEYKINTKEGKVKYIEVKSSPILYKGKDCILGSAYEITDRKHIETALLQSEEKYRTLYNDSLIAMLRISPKNGKLLTANKRAAELFGYENEFDLVENFDAENHYNDPKQRNEVFSAIKKFEIIKNKEILFKKTDGTPIWLSVNEKLYSKYGFIEVALMDITEKKVTEELKKCYLEISEIMNSQAELNELFIEISECLKRYIHDVKIGIGMMDSGVDMLFFPFFEDTTEDEYTIISIDDSDNLASDVINFKDTIYFDKSHIERYYKKNNTTPKGTLPNYWIGIPFKLNNEVLGTMIVQRYTSTKGFSIEEIDLLETISRQIALALARQRSNDEIKIINKNLEERIFERTNQLEDAAEELRAEANIRIKAQKELQAAKDDLEKALEAEKELSELKTRFVSVVSHEYRTPLTVILLATDLLEICYDNQIKHEFKKNIKKVRTSVTKMSSLLEDVLIYGKASRDKLEYKPDGFNILDMLENTINDITLVNNGRNEIIWKNDVIESNIYSDQSLISHIVTNLISNAAKYSPNGKPVHVSLVETSDSFIFKVKDEGIGIPEKDQKHLFTAFHRSTNTGAIEGTGLGLSIVKQCVDTLNGEITVKSVENEGSLFKVIFPKEK